MKAARGELSIKISRLQTYLLAEDFDAQVHLEREQFCCNCSKTKQKLRIYSSMFFQTSTLLKVEFPPEFFMHRLVDEKTDVYAFGVLLLELITGRQAVDSSQQSLVMWIGFLNLYYHVHTSLSIPMIQLLYTNSCRQNLCSKKIRSKNLLIQL